MSDPIAPSEDYSSEPTANGPEAMVQDKESEQEIAPPDDTGLAPEIDTAAEPVPAPEPAMPELPAPAPKKPGRSRSDRVQQLEARVFKLEEALAYFQKQMGTDGEIPLPTENPVATEDRIQVKPNSPAPAEPLATAGPAESPPVAKPAAEAPVATMVMPAVASPAPPAGSPEAAGQPRPSAWLFMDFLQDMRTWLRMYGDPRYQLTWLGRLSPLVLLAFVIIANWIPSVPVVGYLVNNLVIVVIAFFTFKILTREAMRYRATVPDAVPTKPPKAK